MLVWTVPASDVVVMWLTLFLLLLAGAGTTVLGASRLKSLMYPTVLLGFTTTMLSISRSRKWLGVADEGVYIGESRKHARHIPWTSLREVDTVHLRRQVVFCGPGGEEVCLIPRGCIHRKWLLAEFIEHVRNQLRERHTSAGGAELDINANK